MTTKQRTPKKARGSRASDTKKQKPKKVRGTLAKLPRSPVRQAALDYLDTLPTPIRFSDHYAGEANDQVERFAFEKENESSRIPERAWDVLLDDIRLTGNITKSCQRVGIKRITLYKKAERDEDFHKELERAHQTGLRRLEDVAVTRATEGVSKPVFFQGEIVGYTQEYSDQLLQFLLSGNHKKYRAAKKGDEDGEPRGSGVLVVPAELDSDDWEAKAIIMQKKLREEVRD